MAIRARSDNLSLDHPEVVAAPPLAPVHDFSELWAHREALRQACYRMVGNEATAEDLVQETYLRALSSDARFEVHRSVVPWLTTVARRRSIDELRFRRRLSVVDTPPEPTTPSQAYSDPAQQVVNQERVDRLRQALAELSPRERQLLLRQVSHGVSLAEMAADEQTSVASVRSVLARARQKLRASLERGGTLGGLPLPWFLRSLRGRMHRWAAQAEGSLPLLTGAGWQVGQVVAVVVAVLASLLGGNPPPWPGTEVVTLASEVGAAAEVGWAEAEATASDANGVTTTTTTTARVASDEEPPESPTPSLSVLLPTLPDGADQPEQATITSLAESDDGRVILAGASPNSATGPTIYRSTDQGATWTRLPATNYRGGTLLLPPGFPAQPRIFAVGSSGIQVSEDGGISFLSEFPGRGDGVLSADYASGDERLFIAGPPPMSYRAGDPGPTPINVVPPSTSQGGIDIGPTWATNKELLVGTTTLEGSAPNAATVYSCTAQGCTKRFVHPDARGAPHIITSRSTPGYVIAWFGNWFFRSVDGGITFTRKVIPPGLAVASVYEAPNGDVYAAGVTSSLASGLFVSHNYGDSWSAIGQGSLVGSGTRAILRLSGGRLIAALAPHGGVACSDDDGVTWNRRCP